MLAEIHEKPEPRKIMSDSIRVHFDEVKDRWMPRVLELIEQVISESSPPGSSLVPMAQYHFATGGKRLRALIPFMVAEALGEDPERVLGLAAACEILHNATLVHDDLQDGDTTRRGEPTVWAKWGAARAINLGDAMLYWTVAALEHVDFDARAKWLLTQRLLRDTLQVIDGQEREFLLQSSSSASLDDYFRMVEGKTSGLFALPMGGSAQLCGAPQELVDGLVGAAMHLGVLFQLQDDVLDLYGAKGRGMAGSDLGEGKFSALVAHFFEHGDPDDVAWLSAVLRAPRAALRAEEVSQAAELFRTSGTLPWVLDEIDRRHRLAVHHEGVQSQPAIVDLVAGLADLFVAPIAAVR